VTDVISQVGLTGLLLEGDEAGWIQFLVIGVLVAMSALSGIVKSRKQRKDLEREETPVSTPPQRPVRRQEVSRALQERPARQAVQPLSPEQGGQMPGRAKPRTIISPGSALGAFVAEIKAEIKRAADEMQGRTPPTQRPAPPPEPRQPAKVAMPAVKTAPPQRVVRAKYQEKADDLSEIVPEFSGPDDLRRAIVYYEILGKPVSLRGRTGHLIGL